MTTLTIPTTPGDPFYVQRTRLDDSDFVLHFSYNQRTERWYLSVHDDEDAPILSGLKLVANWPLLRHYHADTRVPPGELIVVDLTGDGSPPTLDELGPGRRCELIYQPAA